MSNIHPTAIVDANARLHPSVVIGPFSIVEGDVEIGADSILDSHVRIFTGTRLGARNRVCHGAVLGCEPQDLSFSPDKSKPLVIGDDNHFKEGVNLSRGVKTEAGSRVGDRNYFMCNAHLGHDCIIGNDNIFGPAANIAGHVEIGDHCFISGVLAVHQFVRIGDRAMLAGMCKVVKDVPPYATCDGNPATLIGINSIGLRRAGYSAESRAAIKRTYKTLHQEGMNTSQALESLQAGDPQDEVRKIIDFYLASARGVTRHR